METKYKFLTQRNIIILTVAFWIYIIFLYLWNTNSMYDPFYLSRLAELNSNINYFNPEFFQNLPYSYSLNVILVRILGDNFIQNGYIPFVQFIALFSLLALGKSIYKKFENPYRSFFFIIPIVVFLNIFFTSLPYQEYSIGYALYPLFLWGLFNYINKRSYQLAILLILIFMTIHFFAIPMSTWIIEFVTVYSLLIYLSKYLGDNKNLKYAISTTFITLLIVIWIFWNYKLLDSLVNNSFSINTIFDLLGDLIYSRTGGTLSDFQYAGVSSNPLILVAGRINLVLTYFPILALFLYNFLKRDILFFMRSKDDIFLISLIFPFIFEFLIYGSSGQLSFRYPALIFPFISYYYILKYFSDNKGTSKFRFMKFLKTNGNKFINLYLILMVLSSFVIVGSQLNRSTSALPYNSLEEVSKWYPNYIKNDSNLVTDYKTETYFRYYLKSENSSFQATRITFTSKNYAYIIGFTKNKSDAKNLQYLMVDNKNLDQPVIQGPPAWIKLEPLSYYIERINQNPNMNVIYDSNYIKIYKRERLDEN